ncbi:MAG: MotA/TolQ/ExbB proton channel family protein [Aquabacterium sp.]|uniref:MotA/TolQ/ExbB proton channel family protein n=1 Tax=Aquabacterium sp. TaxID=1872578 RepID=UPI001B5A99F8|nr:MotA/TolQ/ExbB proton channel family protein [Aquabacterium sp.]MBP7131273.1 MotA/TolQ/ExbB proton channel family protein [Aquabacterium sp.]MBP9062411.1 MotA/TolQ/ExbB proton channel family protein [Aquabacterium sp.]
MLSILQAAGWPIIPLVLCSILGLALIVERFLSLRASRVTPPRLVDEVLTVTRTGLPPADTIDKLAENSVMGQLLAEGLSAAAADASITEGRLRLVFEAAGRKAIHKMERYLNALGTIASAAPLLGLLGTLIGMIEIFGASGVGDGGSANPAALAHGISVALYNTAFGLIVAIPALICHRHFRTRIDGYTMDMEEAAERLLQHLMRLPGKRNGG